MIPMCYHCGDEGGDWFEKADGMFQCGQCGTNTFVGTLDKCAACGSTSGNWNRMGGTIHACGECLEKTHVDRC